MKRKYSYSEIKSIYFEDAFCFCSQQFGHGLVRVLRNDGSEFGFAQDEMPELENPLENLMFMTIVVIQNAGRNELIHISWLESIKKTISENTLEKLISDLTPEERQYENEGYGFLCDLNLVLNNQKLERE